MSTGDMASRIMAGLSPVLVTSKSILGDHIYAGSPGGDKWELASAFFAVIIVANVLKEQLLCDDRKPIWWYNNSLPALLATLLAYRGTSVSSGYSDPRRLMFLAVNFIILRLVFYTMAWIIYATSMLYARKGDEGKGDEGKGDEKPETGLSSKGNPVCHEECPKKC
eukprot:GHVQ01029699.1.p1 GENE.GHVQ01029699.1~~GHVQ01029699.1.p1  ORF type:complete len:166 (-),score=16.17 GHVQ01029699.1:192-689(-)